MASSTAVHKARAEAERIIRSKDKFEKEGVFGAPKSIEDPLNWIFVIRGQKGSNYEGGYWVANLTLPKDYPYKPPYVRFETKILHPNISKSGDVCHDWLTGSWLPTIRIIDLMKEIRGLLITPNFDDPLNIDAATLYKKDPKEFDKTVKEDVATNARKSSAPKFSTEDRTWR